ncbi:MAG: tetratricopeptide repeat protein, partial [Myxococcales bacterium]|nr:tetratricopeptide repeat protein [Myxococcales bacterium]
MSVDRAKAQKAAQKYLSKGQIDRAIVEYRKVVEADPSDARSLLKLGDLYTKQGAIKEGNQAYRVVAEQYANQGFFLKAVAVFKQMLKSDPADLSIWQRLGEMYEALSLTSDALSTYEQVVEGYARAGHPDGALEALGRIGALDPNNVAATIRYAEGMSKADRIDEAVDAFRRGADVLKAQGRVDDYVKVTERLLFHSHEDIDRALDVAAIYIERSQPKPALSHLQTCFKADPKAPATLGLLARAFQLLEQPGKAISVYRELAGIHAAKGATDDEVETLRRLLELAPGDAQARQRLGELSQLSGPLPTEDEIDIVEDDDLDELVILDEDEDADEDGDLADGSDSPAFEHDREDPSQEIVLEDPDLDHQPRDRNAQVSRMLSECDVFVRYGMWDKVHAQLDRVLDIDPDHVEARKRLKAAYLQAGQTDEAVMQLLILSENPHLRGPDEALALIEEAASLAPNNPAVTHRLEELRSPLPAAEPASADNASLEVDAGAQDGEGDDDDVIFLDDEEAGDQEADAEFDFVDDDDDDDDGGADEEEIAFVDDDGAEFDDGALTAQAPEAAEAPSFAIAAPEPSPAAPPPIQAPSVAAPVSTPKPTLDVEEDDELPEEVEEALDEADFYLSQDLPDDARDALQDALESFPTHPALQAKLQEIEAAAADAENPEPAPALSAPPGAPPLTHPAAPPAMSAAPAARPIAPPVAPRAVSGPPGVTAPPIAAPSITAPPAARPAITAPPISPPRIAPPATSAPP